jgi:hypothetical protein
MSSFDLLSREEQNLNNPAFTALLVARAVQGYEQENGSACPVPLAVLAPVMALTSQLRAVLPTSISTTTVNWIEREASARVHLTQAVPHLGPIVKAGVLFGLKVRAVEIVEGHLLRSTGKLRKSIVGDTAEVVEIQKASLFLGRWLSRAGNTRTIFTLLGVRP